MPSANLLRSVRFDIDAYLLRRSNLCFFAIKTFLETERHFLNMLFIAIQPEVLNVKLPNWYADVTPLVCLVAIEMALDFHLAI